MDQNEQKKQFRCTGECLNCPRVQHEYCAAQKSLENQRLLMAMQETLKTMSGTVEELKEKVAAIQDSEAAIFDPNADNNIGSSDANVGSNIESKDAGPSNDPAPKSPLIH